MSVSQQPRPTQPHVTTSILLIAAATPAALPLQLLLEPPVQCMTGSPQRLAPCAAACLCIIHSLLLPEADSEILTVLSPLCRRLSTISTLLAAAAAELPLLLP